MLLSTLKDTTKRKFLLHYGMQKLGLLGCLILSSSVFSQSSLIESFTSPPADARPWTSWYWKHDASRESLRANLGSMKKVGIGGVYLRPQLEELNFLNISEAGANSSQWWKLLEYSLQSADTLGIQFGLYVGDHSYSPAMSLQPEESMQKVVSADTILTGGRVVSVSLPQPEMAQNYYQDIAIYALRMPRTFSNVLDLRERDDVKITSDSPENPSPFSASDEVFRTHQAACIQYTFEEYFTLRSVELEYDNSFSKTQSLSVWSSNDGIKYSPVAWLNPISHQWTEAGTGLTTYVIPPTKAKFFRVMWNPILNNTEKSARSNELAIRTLQLSTYPRITHWQGKTGLFWQESVETTEDEIPNSQCTPIKKVLNLTSYFANGILNFNLPRGEWRIVRMGHTCSLSPKSALPGVENAELRVDRFSRSAVQQYFDSWLEAAYAHLEPDLMHRVVKYLHIDTQQSVGQNWSSNFAEEFRTRRGYDLLAYLPVLAGFPIESAHKSEQVLRDVRQTVSELQNEVYFKVMSRSIEKNGFSTSAGSLGSLVVSDAMQHFQVGDVAVADFPLEASAKEKLSHLQDAVCAAHIYGKQVVQAPSFTQFCRPLDKYPDAMKAEADRSFALGINRLMFDVFEYNPYLSNIPGFKAEERLSPQDGQLQKSAKAFIGYLTRTQSLLQYGKPVADVAVYSGEDISLAYNNLEIFKTYLPGLIKGGQSNEIQPLMGYTYDIFNKDALLHTATLKDRQMMLSHGEGYKVVVFPARLDEDKKPLPFDPEVEKKIKELEVAGVKVIRTKGFVQKDFSVWGVKPDLIVPKNIVWTHRRSEMADLYFISNHTGKDACFYATFRVSDRLPSRWNPITGEISAMSQVSQNDESTRAVIQLASGESTFVVFSYKNYVDSRTDLLFEDSITMNARWRVDFLQNSQKVVSDTLFDWRKSENQQIKLYSGVAVYRNNFTLKADYSAQMDENTKPIWLSLGKVSTLASVRVNGIECGMAWTVPYRVDISKALKKGNNLLEIEVTNSRTNVSRQKSDFMSLFPTITVASGEEPVTQAGLIGPVLIKQ